MSVMWLFFPLHVYLKIPILFAPSMQAKDDEAAGNAAAANTKATIALTLNIIAVFFHFAAIIVIAIVTTIAALQTKN